MAKTKQEKEDAKREREYEKKHKRKYRLTPGDIVFYIFNYLFFTLFTITCIFPFWYLFVNTVSRNDYVQRGIVNFWPKGFNIQNYLALKEVSDLGSAFIISVSRTLIGTALMVIASAFIGYLVTKQEMWHRSFWYRFLVITMYFNAGLIPMFITMKNLHLTNTFWVYVIPTIVQPFNIILVKTYVESLPKALQEAAEIDGAGIFKIFYKIILPTCTPILATVAIFAAVNQWNNYQDTLIYITDQKLYSLQYLLYTYINQASSLAAMVRNSGAAGMSAAALATQQTGTSIQMTVSVVVVLPILCIYPMFQRFFVKGIMIGSVKG